MQLKMRPWDMATLSFLAVGVACLTLGWQLNDKADELESLLNRVPVVDSSRLTEEALTSEFIDIRQGIHWSQILARTRSLKAAAVGLVAIAALSFVASFFCHWEERLRRRCPSASPVYLAAQVQPDCRRVRWIDPR